MSKETTRSTPASRTSYLASLRNKVEEMSSPKGFTNQKDDERYWKLEVDKTGTGSAAIRFLPCKSGEEFPFVQLFTHGFQGPSGKWYIENCPTSIGNECPACKANSALWNTGLDADKKLASARKRKLNYISNILIVNDPKRTDNNGLVKLYKYGKKIFEKIKDQISPPAEFADLQPLDPFCPDSGANFKLRQVKVDSFPNYDKSSFDNATSIGDDDRINEVLEKLYSLNDILDPKNFKSFEKLSEQFAKVVGEPAPAAAQEESTPGEDLPVAKPRTARTTAPKGAGKTATAAAPKTEEADGDDFFAKLAQQADE